jgi:hypothetical protein
MLRFGEVKIDFVNLLLWAEHLWKVSERSSPLRGLRINDKINIVHKNASKQIKTSS